MGAGTSRALLEDVRASLFLLAALAACKASNPDDDIDKLIDGGGDVLRAPIVEAPSATPLDTVALRGMTEGAARIVVKPSDSDLSQVESLLPGGSFCVDAPLTLGADRTFRVYAIAEDGRISDPTEVTVTQDSGVPQPPGAQCDVPADCVEEEICDNDEDDDCNAFKDECDPGCNGCVDDFLEPNDTPFDVPLLGEGTHDGLVICPCRDDWYAFPLQGGQTLRLTVTFTHALIDIDLKLFTADAAESQGAPVASSVTTMNVESIEYRAAQSGVYYLRVYAFSQDKPQGSYKITVN